LFSVGFVFVCGVLVVGHIGWFSFVVSLPH
jgi:hypothetical protein